MLLPHLHLLVHTLLVRLGQAENGSSCLAVAPVLPDFPAERVSEIVKPR